MIKLPTKEFFIPESNVAKIFFLFKNKHQKHVTALQLDCINNPANEQLPW